MWSLVTLLAALFFQLAEGQQGNCPTPCHPNANCTGSHCECQTGYAGDGLHCTNINECEDLNLYSSCRVCHYNARCTDTDGSYICTCNEGYYGDGHCGYYGCLGPDVICASSIPSTIIVEVFTPMKYLIRRFGCYTPHVYTGINSRFRFYTDCGEETYYDLLYNITMGNRNVLLSERQDVINTLVAEWFEEGSNAVHIVVCKHPFNNYNVCASYSNSVKVDMGDIEIVVRPNTARLFPFGNLTGGLSFDGVVDGAVEIQPPNSIPFFNNYYRSLHVSNNGIVTLNRQFLSWSPTPFPFGRSRVPVIAPLWVDFDFRNNVPCSAVSYNSYVNDGSPSLGRAVFSEYNRRMTGSDFRPEWIAVVTWNNSTPYPFYFWQFQMGMATFQLVIASDYIETHAFYIYANSTITPFTWQSAVVGYDAKDFQNYFNLNMRSQDLVMLHRTRGNTGRIGEWHFNFTSPPGQMTAEQRCMNWARRQRGQLLVLSSLRVRHCPCTRQQAEMDWRFWFGYFWGLSSSPNCATVLFSGSQHTLECCYDRFGALLVGEPEGGSYKRFHPLIFHQQYYDEDVLPYFDCCVNSRRCRLYYNLRPSDNCARYTPFIPSFMFGDPHLQTLDRRNFPFNGIGEYILVHTPPSVGFDVQARMDIFSSNVTGTVITNIVVKLGDIPGIEVEAGSDQLHLYIDGVLQELAVGDSPILVVSSGILSRNLTGGIGDLGDPMAMMMTSEQLSVRMESERSIAIGIGEGGTVVASLQTNFLAIAVALPDSYRNQTSGLLGVFNDNPDDDFRDRNGTVLNLFTEREIYKDFGLKWHVAEEESLFNYTIGATSYSAINDGYLAHQPLFTDDLNVTEEVREMCQGSSSCIYDSVVTGNMDIGASTLGVSEANRRTIQILENSPPLIDGNFTLFANAGVGATATFYARDPDSDDFVDTFSCLNPVEGIICTSISNLLQVRWLNPRTPFPNVSLTIIANDSTGALTVREISVVLCQCNTGSCIMEGSDSFSFNENRYYQRPCQCPAFFSGDSCEINERGCGEFSLCIGSQCINDSTQASGYVCGECLPGYGSGRSGEKCTDINECSGANNCAQMCTNTEGSYTCSCLSGYLLMEDQVSCADVDECIEGNSNCSQSCINAEGTYVCTCEPGYSLGADGRTCHVGTCGDNPCTPGLSCVELSGQYECLCAVGQQCSRRSVCMSTDKSILRRNTQLCEGCGDDTYGVRCSQNCSGCSGNGNCNGVRGCVCNSGWSGLYCNQELNLVSPTFHPDTPARLLIPWILTAGAEILRVVAIDYDTGPNASLVNYTLTNSPYPLPFGISNGRDVFEIDPSSGQISVLADQQLESNTQFLLTISASDNGQPPRMTLHTINLVPIPIPELQGPTGTIRIDEETLLGTTISQLTCEEIGPPSNSLEIALSGDILGLLRYDAITGLEIARRVDFESLSESEKEYNVTATCSNRYNLTDSISFTVVINNLNDNPFQFEHMRYILRVNENVTLGDAVVVVSASDRDFPNANITYSLDQEAEAADFTIDSVTGEIIVHSNLDRETRALYIINVHGYFINMTGLVERTSAMITIHIADDNDESPQFDRDVYVIQDITADNQIGDLVVTVSASDADAGANGEVTYYLEQENTRFGINESTGAIFITFPLTHGLYNLTVTAEDSGLEPRSSSSLVYVHVLGGAILLAVPEQQITVREDIPVGSFISLVSFAVLDNNSIPFNEPAVRFEIVNTSASDPLFINATTGEIVTTAILDYETLSAQYLLIIRATLASPNQELYNETILSVVVENLDDTPPRFFERQYVIAVEQFTAPRTTILTVSAIDPDNLNSIEYTIFGMDNETFHIDVTTGEISPTVVLDAIRTYQFTVVATESVAREQATASVFISVSRSPMFSEEVFSFSVFENATLGTAVGKVSLAQEDFVSSAGVVRFRPTILSPATQSNFSDAIHINISQGLFQVNPVSGNVSVEGPLDFDTGGQAYVLYVEIYNSETGTIYDTALVEIQVEDVNDNPPVFMSATYTRVLDDAQSSGTVVAVVMATDRDSGNNGLVFYSIDLQEQNIGFVLNSTSGVLSVSNYTLVPGFYNLTIVASDNGIPAQTNHATVFITIIHFIPTAIEFTEQHYRLFVVENSPPESLIGAVQATETNSSIIPSSIMYFMPNITECLSIDEQSGEITVSCDTLDREEVNSYELVVTAQVGNISTSGIVTIDVLDVNDNSPEFSRSTYSLILNTTHDVDDAILQVTARDRDFGVNGTVRYTLLSENSLFTINTTTGKIVFSSGTVDVGDYYLIVEATDLGLPEMSSTARVFLYVTTPHPQTLRFSTNYFSVPENVGTNTTVGVVSLETHDSNPIDPSQYPNDLLFAIADEDNPGLFMIDETNGRLTVSNATLDREEASSHVIVLQANFTRFDSVPVQHIRATFTINVQDENDNSPEMLTSYSTTIDDSAESGEVLFNITATDIDTGSNALVNFDIDSSEVFGVQVRQRLPPFTYGEVIVNDTSRLVAGAYQFTLTATDSGVPPLQTTATVVILVQHAIPEVITFSSPNYTFSILEETQEGTLVGNVSVLPDTPALDHLVYSITGGSGQSYFSIDSASGVIRKLSRRIDKEVHSTFLLSIQAFLPNQDPPLIANGVVTIAVEDINDNSPRFTQAVYSTIGLSTNELNTSHSILSVSATDRDTASNAEVQYNISYLTLNLTAHFDTSQFFVISNAGAVFPASLDIPVGTYVLTIRGSDRGSPMLSGTASVTVVVQRPAPSSIAFTVPSGYTLRLAEHSGNITFARVMLQSLPDYLLEYVNYEAEHDFFTVDQETGNVAALRDFDYEIDEREYEFQVTATFIIPHRLPRAINLSAVVNVTIEIVDANDHTPYFLNFPYEITQCEARATRELVHTFRASDGDVGSNAELSFSLVGVNDSSILAINSVSGEVTAAAGLDREDLLQGANHTVVVRVCDRGVPPRCVENTTIFRLLDINDNSPRLTSGFIYAVRERLPPQTSAYQLIGIDPDLGVNGTIRYSLSPASLPFSCNVLTGQVSTTQELDFESQSSYNITVTLMDMGHPVLSTSYTNITVRVVDVPDNTPQFNQTLYQTTIPAAVLAGEVLFQVKATDADTSSSNDSLRYAITGIEVRENSTNPNLNLPQLTVNASNGTIYSEETQVFIPDSEIVISLLVYDQSEFNLTSTSTLIIAVTPNPLSFTASQYSTVVSEDAPLGSSIASLNLDPLSRASDVLYTFEVLEPPLQSNLIPFTLSGSGTYTAIVGLRLQGNGLNRELTDRYVLLVTASSHNETTQARMTLVVADVNDNSPRLLDAEGSIIFVDEDAPPGSYVTISNATDVDTGDNGLLDFSILSDVDIPFVINGTGVIQTRVKLNENNTLPSYNVTVHVRDSGQPRLEAFITYLINITSMEPTTAPSTTVETSTTEEPTTTEESYTSTTKSGTIREPSTSTTFSAFPIIIVACVCFLVPIAMVMIVIAVVYIWKRKKDKSHLLEYQSSYGLPRGFGNNFALPLAETNMKNDDEEIDVNMFEPK